MRHGSCSSRRLEADIADVQGGTTEEGIHLGAMAGTVDMMQRGYAGLHTHDDVLWLDPALPPKMPELRFGLNYRGLRVAVDITPTHLTLALKGRGCAPIRVSVRGEKHLLSPGETLEFDLPTCEAPIP